MASGSDLWILVNTITFDSEMIGLFLVSFQPLIHSVVICKSLNCHDADSVARGLVYWKPDMHMYLCIP